MDGRLCAGYLCTRDVTIYKLSVALSCLSNYSMKNRAVSTCLGLLQVLLRAGGNGLTIPEIITSANELGVTGPTPWDASSSAKQQEINAVSGHGNDFLVLRSMPAK